MKLTQLEKAQKALVEIKTLDDQIIAIEKMAHKLSDEDEKDVTVNMTYEKPKELESPEVDRDGYDGFLNMSTLFRRYGSSSSSPEKELLSMQFSNSECLQILGMMVLCKQQRREFLINKLRKIGFSV